MARRRLTDHYPPLEALARTIRGKRAHLAGARRFYAGEGVIVFADGKRGLAEVAGESYLPPASYRQLGNFLDQNFAPSVVGFRYTPLPLPAEPMPELAQTSLQQFIAAARTTLHSPFTDQGREINLHAASPSTVAGWDWEGELQYEHFFTLEGGQRIPEEAYLRLYARQHGDDVDVAIIVNQPHDREAAVAWLNKITASKWLPQAVVLPTRDPERLQTIRAVCDVFSIRFAGMRHPDVYPSATADRPREGFLAVLKRAPYETAPTDLDTIVERTDSDAGILGSFTVTLCERAEKAVTNVELRQRPTESFARLTWRSGRSHDGSELNLTDRWWETASPVDWSTERKQLYLLRVWQDILAAIDKATAAAAEAAVSA